MKRTVVRAGAVVSMGMILLASQGCGMKWLQSGGEGEAGSAASGSKAGDAGSNFPGMLRGGSSGELSGFSQNPS